MLNDGKTIAIFPRQKGAYQTPDSTWMTYNAIHDNFNDY
jgi:hypothetical protein